MNLAIFNGSPRRTKSNSTILTEQFLLGLRSISPQWRIKTGYIADTGSWDNNLETYAQADTAIIIFPLYTDCMPGVVKEFFEDIIFRVNGRPKNLGFIVQSGFPEAIHSVAVEKYLHKFASRAGCNYLGTVIKGAVEGLQFMPPWMTQKLLNNFRKLGEHFGKTGTFDPVIVKKLRGPLRMSKMKLWGFKLWSKTNMANFYWDSNLKKNGTFENRFDRPYLPER